MSIIEMAKLMDKVSTLEEQLTTYNAVVEGIQMIILAINDARTQVYKQADGYVVLYDTAYVPIFEAADEYDKLQGGDQ